MPARILLPLLALVCLIPAVSSAEALLLGAFIALAFGNPYQAQCRKITHHLLSLSIIGLGAGMDLHAIGKAGLHGIWITATSILAVLGTGYLLGRLLGVARDTSALISVGTAICGGSAIAAAAPVIRAKPHDVSVALGVVFLLNSLALVIFPAIGHMFQLTQEQFGLWSALAIHDTSSVVGATVQYGEKAMEVGTTVKLTRALWIVPVTFMLGMLLKAPHEEGQPVKARKPWFILGFLAMAALVTWVPALQETGALISTIAKRSLVVALFLIGASLTRETLKAVGAKPLVQGVVLWLITSSVTLALIVAGL